MRNQIQLDFHNERVEGGTKVLGPWHPPSNFLTIAPFELIFTPFDSEWRKEWGNNFFIPQNENLNFYFFSREGQNLGAGLIFF